MGINLKLIKLKRLKLSMKRIYITGIITELSCIVVWPGQHERLVETSLVWEGTVNTTMTNTNRIKNGGKINMDWLSWRDLLGVGKQKKYRKRFTAAIYNDSVSNGKAGTKFIVWNFFVHWLVLVCCCERFKIIV